MRTCVLVSCNDKHKALGYCQSHYYRLLCYGDPMGGPEFSRYRPVTTLELEAEPVHLTDEEMRQIGEVVEALAQHALSFVWPALARGELR